VRRDDADAFGGVHRAAAPDRDKAVTALRAIFRGACIDKVDAGVRLDAVEHDWLAVGAAQSFQGGVKQACRFHAGVGDEQRPAHAEQDGLVAKLADGAKTLDKARWTLISAKCVFQH